jgi:hypothetical protein
MEVNTVVISLDRLKELELAEKKVNEPRSKTIVIERSWGYEFVVETDDECAEKLANKVKKQQEEIEKLQEEIKNTIDDVRGMNYWSFRKWKRS